MAKRSQTKLAASLERERRLKDVEKCLLHGVSSLDDLVVRHGVTKACISLDVKEIRKRWANTAPDGIEECRSARIKQLEYIIMLCFASYERSRQDKTIFTTREEPCDNDKCLHGLVKDKEGLNRPCPRCGGEEKIVVETRQVSGQAGDAKWLSVAQSAVMDIARLEGLVISNNQAIQALRTTAERELLPGGAVRERITNLYVQAPEEDVLKLMGMLDNIKNRNSADPPPMNVIEVQAEPHNDGSAAA